MRLARPRRAVQQHSALEVLAAGPQSPGVPGYAQYLAFDGVQHAVRQDHIRTGNRGPVQERHRHLVAEAEHLGAEGDHLAAEHALLADQPPYLLQGGGDAVGVGSGDIQDHLGIRAVLARVHQQREPGTVVVGKVEAMLHAAARHTAGPGRQRGRRHAARTQPVSARVGDQQANPVIHAPHGARDPHQLEPAARPGQPGVQPSLQVHVLIRRPRPRYRRQPVRIPAEMVKQQPPQRLVLGPCGIHRLVHQSPGQPPDVGQFRPPRLCRAHPSSLGAPRRGTDSTCAECNDRECQIGHQ